MSKLRFFFGLMMLLLGTVTLVSCNNDNDDDDSPMPEMNAVEFLASNPDYSLLHEALIEAGLSGTLAGPGPFTIFAPDDAAFQSLLTTLGVGSLAEIDDDLLESVLLYHVLGQEVPAAAVTTGYASSLSPSTQVGNPSLALFLNTSSGVSINDVDVTEADMEVSNGVIHGIDEVLLLPDVTSFVTYDPEFSTLGSALAAADDADDENDNFIEILQGDGPFTVFAPVNSAFTDLLDGNDDWSSLDDIDDDLLESVLLYHVVDGNVRSSDLMDGMEVSSLSGASFTVDLSGTSPMLVDGSGQTVAIMNVDAQATNGVVHGIDKVLLPE